MPQLGAAPRHGRARLDLAPSEHAIVSIEDGELPGHDRFDGLVEDDLHAPVRCGSQLGRNRLAPVSHRHVHPPRQLEPRRQTHVAQQGSLPLECGARTEANESALCVQLDDVAALARGDAQVAALADAPSSFTLIVDGKAEGRYRVTGSIKRAGRVVLGRRSWSDYSIRLETLFCERESDWDRGTSDDEPFLLALVVNQAPGEVLRHRTSPFANVDAGESRTIGFTFPNVRVPDDVGYLTLPIQLLESDEELGSHRNRALQKFAEGVEAGVAKEREGFVRTFGRAVAADWKLARAEVFAFTRDDTVTAGLVYSGQLNRWVRARQRVVLPLALTKPVRVNGLRPPT